MVLYGVDRLQASLGVENINRDRIKWHPLYLENEASNY